MIPADWLLLASLIPALVAAALLPHRTRPAATRLAPFASLPMLAAAVAALGQPAADYPALLVGIRIGVDTPALLLIAAAAIVWTLAGFRLVRQPGRVLGAALLAQTGSLGALTALDPVGFYLFFSVMTVASYGLVMADRTAQARAAARIYLAFALGGEMLALAALLLAAAGVGGTGVALLLFFGLGAKLGIPPLHIALPVAYQAAPAAAGAVIASALVNAAIAGLLRFLPATGPDPVIFGSLLIVIGLGTAAFGAIIGVMQSEPKALLGYSTVSQMGILTVALGAAAGLPNGFTTLAPAIALFALHHSLVKAALFLALDSDGASISPQTRLTVLILLSLALAAAPFTGGALAKLWIESEAYGLGRRQLDLIHSLLPLTSTATAVLMARFVMLVQATSPPRQAADPGPFLASASIALVAPWPAAAALHPDPVALAGSADHIWLGIWPLGIAGGVLLIARRGRQLGWRLVAIPPGDLLALARPAWRRLFVMLQGLPHGDAEPDAGWLRELSSRFDVAAAEKRLRGFRSFGLSYLLLLAALIILAGWP